MTDLITVTGVVGTDPRAIVTQQGIPITSFRLASTRRIFDREKGTWQDGETNWYGISAFRKLAFNANASLRKGERVIVHGRLKLRPWQAGERSGTAVEIEAESIGHDLTWGITQLQRLRSEPAAGTSTDGADVGADGAEGEVPDAPADGFTDAVGAGAPASDELVPAALDSDGGWPYVGGFDDHDGGAEASDRTDPVERADAGILV
ncbi:single-stranded DNA-binding protein [Agromyces protaetiae]|uniref:Single-stranded DNA-binding protein n=1 Tax=Agromyces protaetiae TaxID=2509455 RepID=A0A4P6FH49_9MICO|nr:single-stranded DNA-binding protein [Agromyces protaetiae]QAY73839.1 single-stranded DNA-binding protein [Agromyces protaetiae]